MGNYVNQGTVRGDALGFSLEYITSVKPLRANAADTNMLTFLLDVIHRECPEALSIVSELSFLSGIGSLKFSDLEEQVGAMKRSADHIRSLVDRYKDFVASLKGGPENFSPDLDTFITATKISQPPTPSLHPTCKPQPPFWMWNGIAIMGS